ncbi:hypothetical protein CBM2626_B60028 [Cupriavidus taiwanensis]|nr:hypothetical protein CBM2626_B60028 [Cupriavidus taiwanensis]
MRFRQGDNLAKLGFVNSAVYDQTAGRVRKPRLLRLDPVGDARENHEPCLSLI